MSSYSLRTDVEKNRLYLTLDGFFEYDKIVEVAQEIMIELKRLKTGYSFINDVSNFKPTTEEGVEEIKKIQLYMYNNGLGKVVRVVGKSLMSKLQFERKSKEVGYSAEHVQTVTEAEKILDECSV